MTPKPVLPSTGAAHRAAKTQASTNTSLTTASTTSSLTTSSTTLSPTPTTAIIVESTATASATPASMSLAMIEARRYAREQQQRKNNATSSSAGTLNQTSNVSLHSRGNETGVSRPQRGRVLPAGGIPNFWKRQPVTEYFTTVDDTIPLESPIVLDRGSGMYQNRTNITATKCRDAPEGTDSVVWLTFDVEPVWNHVVTDDDHDQQSSSRPPGVPANGVNYTATREKAKLIMLDAMADAPAEDSSQYHKFFHTHHASLLVDDHGNPLLGHRSGNAVADEELSSSFVPLQFDIVYTYVNDSSASHQRWTAAEKTPQQQVSAAGQRRGRVTTSVDKLIDQFLKPMGGKTSKNSSSSTSNQTNNYLDGKPTNTLVPSSTPAIIGSTSAPRSTTAPPSRQTMSPALSAAAKKWAHSNTSNTTSPPLALSALPSAERRNLRKHNASALDRRIYHPPAPYSAVAASRFRDWNELLYSMRSLYRYGVCGSTHSSLSTKPDAVETAEPFPKFKGRSETWAPETTEKATFLPAELSLTKHAKPAAPSHHVQHGVSRIRTVYIVVGHKDQAPTWLSDSIIGNLSASGGGGGDGGGPEVRIVTHDEIFPKEDRTFLPSFNSHGIESVLHRIAGIGRYYVYFNNDMFWTRPMSWFDYFRPISDARQDHRVRRMSAAQKQRWRESIESTDRNSDSIVMAAPTTPAEAASENDNIHDRGGAAAAADGVKYERSIRLIQRKSRGELQSAPPAHVARVTFAMEPILYFEGTEDANECRAWPRAINGTSRYDEKLHGQDISHEYSLPPADYQRDWFGGRTKILNDDSGKGNLPCENAAAMAQKVVHDRPGDLFDFQCPTRGQPGRRLRGDNSLWRQFVDFNKAVVFRRLPGGHWPTHTFAHIPQLMDRELLHGMLDDVFTDIAQATRRARSRSKTSLWTTHVYQWFALAARRVVDESLYISLMKKKKGWVAPAVSDVVTMADIRPLGTEEMENKQIRYVELRFATRDVELEVVRASKYVEPTPTYLHISSKQRVTVSPNNSSATKMSITSNETAAITNTALEPETTARATTSTEAPTTSSAVSSSTIAAPLSTLSPKWRQQTMIEQHSGTSFLEEKLNHHVVRLDKKKGGYYFCMMRTLASQTQCRMETVGSRDLLGGVQFFVTVNDDLPRMNPLELLYQRAVAGSQRLLDSLSGYAKPAPWERGFEANDDSRQQCPAM